MAINRRTGKRAPKNHMECPRCGRTVLTTNRRHLGNPQCVVSAAERALRDRGLRYVAKTYLTWLSEAQIPVEEHPHRVDLLTDWEMFGRRARSGEKTVTERVENGFFALSWVVAILEAVSQPTLRRRKALIYAAKNPDFAQALMVVRDHVGRAQLHDMIEFAAKQISL